MVAEGTVPASLVRAVADEEEAVAPPIAHDFGLPPPPLWVELYPTHRELARALLRRRHTLPQSSTDDTSSVLHGVLLLGPLPADYRRHNLAHLYTEWVLDRLTGNRTDSLPPNPWLYDGLAEYEAYRYAPASLPCSGMDTPFDVARIRTARAWLALRAGPLGSLEYCLAYRKVRQIVNRMGWRQLVSTLRRTPNPWNKVPPRLARI